MSTDRLHALARREQQNELALRVTEGHAGALDFVLHLTREPDGWDLLQRLDDEKPTLKGMVLYNASRNAGAVLAMTATADMELNFCAIARRLLA